MKIWKIKIAQLLMPMALVLTGVFSQSTWAALNEPPTVTASNESALPEGTAFPTLTFTFPDTYQLTTATLYIDYDPSKLTFDEAASKLKIGAVVYDNLTTALTSLRSTYAGIFESSEQTAGNYSLTLSFFVPSHFELASGASFKLTGAFDLNQGFTAGMTDTIKLHGALSSTAHDSDFLRPLDTFGQGPFAEAGTPLAATVTAVPEPETWLMLLGGLGLIAVRVQRRRSR